MRRTGWEAWEMGPPPVADALACAAVRVQRRSPLLAGMAVGVRGRLWRRGPGHCRLYLTTPLPRGTTHFLVTPTKGGTNCWVEVQVDEGLVWAVDVLSMNLDGKRRDVGFHFLAMGFIA